MLRDLGLTYVIQDEVLQITTPDEAEGRLVTKVYPVADLVIPIQSMGGGMGMMGGMMGGMGGHDGRHGRHGMDMMGGMGGMGGMGAWVAWAWEAWAWEAWEAGSSTSKTRSASARPRIRLSPRRPPPARPAGTQPTAATPADPAAPVVQKPRPAKAIQIAPTAGQTVAQAWDAYFGQPDEQIDEAALRQTLRERMTAHEFGEVVEILQSALRSGYVRPWMYEALGLALEANKAPAEEVERAILSATDLTGDANEVMLAAVYLARMGHEARALKLLQEVAQVYPLRPEPYIQGLELARRLNDTEGKQWAVTHILRQAWPKEHRDVQEEAVRTAQSTLQELMQTAPEKAEAFRTAVQQAIGAIAW